MIRRVISGGQVGADIAGLRAARALGIETGGTAPKGYRTLQGRNQELASYSLVEHDDWRYPPRTRENVRNSDATIRFATNWSTPGERATLREIRAAQKPYFDVTIEWAPGLPGHWTVSPSVREAKHWLREQNIAVLNVAGNGKPVIERIVEEYMKELLS